MDYEGSDSFLMVRQCVQACASSYIPSLYHFVVWACDNLRLVILAYDRLHSVWMASQAMDLQSRTNVPNPRHCISSTRHEQVKMGVQGDRVNTTQMAVIAAHNFVNLQIPALDHFVFSNWEQKRRAVWDGKCADCVDVSCESQQAFSFDQVPEFDGAVRTAWNDEFVFWIHC